jgi:hypothetical protein
MQRSEEKIGANTSKMTPKIGHQSGNVNVFVLGTAMAIAAMWLVFQHDAEGAPTLSAVQAASASSSTELLHSVAVSERYNIVEVIVTAPRLIENTERFERPAKEMALLEPKAPKTFWQSAS